MVAKTSAHDVLKACWAAGLSLVEVAAVLAEFSAQTIDLSEALAAGFATFSLHGDIPPRILSYLSFSLHNALLKPADLFNAIAKITAAGDSAIVSRYAPFAPIVSQIRIAAPDELIARLLLLKAIRPYGLAELCAALVQPFGLIDDPTFLPGNVRLEMIGLIGVAEEPELAALAARLEAKDVPIIRRNPIRQTPTQDLPVELWHGVDAILKDGPTDYAEMLTGNLIALRCLRTGAGSQESAVAQLAAFLDSRMRLPREDGLGPTQVLTAYLLDCLLAIHKGWKAHDTPTSRAAGIWASFAYSRFPALLAILSKTKAGSTFSQWSEATASALAHLRYVTRKTEPTCESETMNVDNEEGSEPLHETFHRYTANGLHSAGLLNENAMLELGIEVIVQEADLHELSSQYSVPDMIEVLNGLLITGADTTTMVAQLAELLDSWASSRSYSELGMLVKALSDEPRYLDIVFLYTQPRSILSPVARVVDAFATQHEGNGLAFDHIGNLTSFLQLAVQRYQLHHDLPGSLGSNDGYCVEWLGTAPRAHPTKGLHASDLSIVSAWIAALYGEGGIADELISGTNPCALIKVAPTIIQQSAIARKMGILSTDSLKDGLSYFCQDVLNFTLPGVLNWIASEVARLPLASPLALILQNFLKTFVTTDSTPRAALELSAPAVQRLADLDASVSASYSRVMPAPPSLMSATQPEEVDALAALHAGSTTARFPALRAVLLGASREERRQLVQHVSLEPHILATPGHRVSRWTFPLLAAWTPAVGDERRAAEALMCAESYEENLIGTKGTSAETLARHWWSQMSPESRERLHACEGFALRFSTVTDVDAMRQNVQ